MIKIHRLIQPILLVAVILASTAVTAKSKKKNKTPALSALKADSVKTIAKATKGATKKQGLFTIYFNQKEGKLFFELPDSAFDKLYMLSSRIASTSDGSDYVAGQMNVQPFAISFSTDERNVYLHQVMSLNTVVPGDAITPSFHDNNLNPVLAGFKIVAREGKNLLIDVSKFFCSNEKSISPLKNTSPISKLLGGTDGIKGTFMPDASGFVFAKSFPKNIEIESMLSYQTTGVIPKPYTVKVHRSLFALPDENLMPMRLQDNRVGYFYTDKNVYSSDADRIEERAIINRWDLRPRKEDVSRYFAGQLVEPEKPIVFYVDSAFPDKWRSTIKEGIEVWNKAFETAGFKNAVRALDYPKDDPDFDPDDMRYNCFRYVATSTANAMGPSYVDPRTGEILAANVIWYHNIVSLLHNWRFVQTGAVDARVRKAKFDDDVMRESIKYAASHEVGHTLGLMHNMGASFSFPVDSLRSPSFTQLYGTTPSIMDYARNNYVAQPGDMERGVKLTPPELGVYDIYAINWGYRLIKDADNPEAEKATLDTWIAAKAGDAKFQFGPQQFFSTVDPTCLTEDLGDDHVKASDYGISNLKVLMDNFLEWTKEDGERYDNVEKMYMEVTKQYGRYLKHVLPVVGGVVYKEIRQGDGQDVARRYVGKVAQRNAMQWLLSQVRSYDKWLTPAGLVQKLEIDMNVNDKLRQQIVGSLMNASVLYRIKEGGNLDPRGNYRLVDYLSDLTNSIFVAPKGGVLEAEEQSLQAAALAQMIRLSGLVPAASKTSKSTLADLQVESDCIGDNADHYWCGCAYDSFYRVNLGVSALTKDEMGMLMMGRLKTVLQKYRSYRNSAIGLTRDFYDYQIHNIQQVLTFK